MINVTYSTILYRYILNATPTGSILNLQAAVDIPEGSILSINTSGQFILATASTVPVAVARHPAKALTQLAGSRSGIVENKVNASLALVAGTRVFAAAAGAIAATGTNAVGIALSADKVLVSIN